MQVVQTVAPTSEPITLDEVKAFAVVFEDMDDALLTSFITVAREDAENYTNRQIMSATFELYTDCLVQDMKMPKNPIQSITKIEYMDDNGDYQLLSDYYLYGDGDISKIHFDTFVSHKSHKKAIKITFIAGYVNVPETIKIYLKHIVSTMYENREKFVVGVSVNEMVGNMYKAMLDKYRVQPL